MLSFDDAVIPNTKAMGLGMAPIGASNVAPLSDIDACAYTMAAAGSGRIRVEDKSIINCHADVNQLVPFKYKWAW